MSKENYKKLEIKNPQIEFKLKKRKCGDDTFMIINDVFLNGYELLWFVMFVIDDWNDVKKYKFSMEKVIAGVDSKISLKPFSNKLFGHRLYFKVSYKDNRKELNGKEIDNTIEFVRTKDEFYFNDKKIEKSDVERLEQFLLELF